MHVTKTSARHCVCCKTRWLAYRRRSRRCLGLFNGGDLTKRQQDFDFRLLAAETRTMRYNKRNRHAALSWLIELACRPYPYNHIKYKQQVGCNWLLYSLLVVVSDSLLTLPAAVCSNLSGFASPATGLATLATVALQLAVRLWASVSRCVVRFRSSRCHRSFESTRQPALT